MAPCISARTVRTCSSGRVRIGGVSTDRLGEILRLIEVSLDEPELSGADLAGRFHLSRFHFDRLVAGGRRAAARIRMLDHHLWLSGENVDRLARLETMSSTSGDPMRFMGE